MREGQYEYIHEFKERISEIIDLQKRHHAILENHRMFGPSGVLIIGFPRGKIDKVFCFLGIADL
jgi:hypothetical protein